jgi:hypothetical protein
MRRFAVGIIALAVLILTGCSAPSTQADEVFVHKGSGITEGHENKGCVPAATREINWGTGMGDDYYGYPFNARVFDFRGVEGSDRGPFEVVSKDGQTLTIPGTMSFTLNTNCDVLTKFHDRIGNRYKAYMEDDQTGAGWAKVLNLYMAPALDASLDRLAKQYTWNELRSDPTIKDKINSEVATTVKRLINQQLEGDEEYFDGFTRDARRQRALAGGVDHRGQGGGGQGQGRRRSSRGRGHRPDRPEGRRVEGGADRGPDQGRRDQVVRRC